MVTLEDFTKQFILQEFFSEQAIRAQCLRLIQKKTARLELVEIHEKNPTLLSLAIATNEHRLAAISLTSAHASPFFYKRARELASAEGALLVLDFLKYSISELNPIAIKNSQATLMLLHHDHYLLAINKDEER